MTPRRWLGVAGAALVVQLVVLYWPRPHVPGAVGGFDLGVHALVFAAVAYPALRAGIPALPVLAGLAGHAAVSEVVQHALVPGRQGDVTDVLADLFGVLVAALVVRRAAAAGPRTPTDLV